MEKTYDIFFSDLVPETQKEVLTFLGLKKPNDANLDILPLTTISQEDVEELNEAREKKEAKKEK